MKKIFILFLLFYFFSQISVHALVDRGNSPFMQNYVDPNDGGAAGNVFEEILRVFFGQDIPDSPKPSNNGSSTTDISGQNIPPGNFPVTDPLPLLNNTGLTYSSSLINTVRGCLNHRGIYEQAASHTGIAWPVLAGIHYREGGCGANKSLVSGRVIGTAEPDLGVNCSSLVGGAGKPKVVAGGCGFASLLDSAIYAGNHLKGKISKIPATHQELAKALSRYNGGGNSNCRAVTPYRYCPPAFEGDDDLYVFNKNPDGKHEDLRLLYCADHIKCNPPRVYEGIGALTAAGVIDSLSKL